MSAQDLAVLRTARQAQQEGLLTQEDFDVIKVAFLKAQQIKAGLDAGFIREEDYVQARDSFLHSLDFRTSMVSASAAPQRAVPVPPAINVRPPPMSQPLANKGSQNLFSSSTPRSASPTASIEGSGSLPFAIPPPSSRASPAPSTGGGGGVGTVAVPGDLPRIGKAGVAVGKKSMSGIGLSDYCINIFNYIKTKSQYKWVIYKIDDGGSEVVVDQLGAPDSTYDQFIAALPSNQCRYGVFDYAYTNADTGQTINKLVFLHWAPDGSTTKSKMMYASTKDFLKSFLDGVGAEHQADSPEELNESEFRDRVHQSLTRK